MNLERVLLNGPNFLMTVFFAAGVGAQYGRPLGMLISGAAGVACILALRNTEIKWLPPVVGLIALTWALTLAPQVIGKVHFNEIFELHEVEREQIYTGRKMVGLLIVAGWMAVLTITSPRHSDTDKK